MRDRLTVDELWRLLADCPRVGSRWRHKKTGNLYRVTGRAIGEAVLTPLVLYQSYASELPWARPLEEWREKFVEET